VYITIAFEGVETQVFAVTGAAFFLLAKTKDKMPDRKITTSPIKLY
jgi:hypothetical protein